MMLSVRSLLPFALLLGVLASAASAQVVTQYTYDGAGRLVGVDDATTLVTYEYDPAGNLIGRIDEPSPVPEPSIGLLAVAAIATLAVLRRRRRHAALAVTALLLTDASTASASKTVCEMGCDFTTIAEALTDPMSVGQDIIVMPGTYNEGNLGVSGRTLMSSSPNDPDGTTIDATGLGQPVISGAVDAVIRGLKIRGGINQGTPGGGIYTAGGTVTLENLIIEFNDSSFGGGGVGTNRGGTLIVKNSTIRNNTAVGAAGGIGGHDTTIIEDSVIEANVVSGVSTTSGGGVRGANFGTVRITNSTILGNRAAGAGPNRGGGISAGSSSLVELFNTTVAGNTADSSQSNAEGGGVHVTNASLTIRGGSISGNAALVGGGLFLEVPGVMSLGGVSITGNSASVLFGGGIYCSQAGVVADFSGKLSGNTHEDSANCGVLVPPGGSGADDDDSGDGGDPVNTFTGEFYRAFAPDLHLGGPMPLAFARYASTGLEAAGIESQLGVNWLHNFAWSLTRVGDEISVVSARGRLIPFALSGGLWIPSGTPDRVYELTELGDVFTLVDPHAERLYLFDANGVLTSVRDGKGNAHTLSYDSTARLAQIDDGLGRTLSLGYEAGGRIETVSDGSRTVTFAYAGTDLGSATDARGNLTSYGYSLSDNKLRSETRPEGNTPFTTSFHAEPARRASIQVDAYGGTYSFTYTGLDTAVTDPLGEIRVQSHDADGNLIGFEDETSMSFGVGYDGSGRRAQIVDRLGDTTSYTYHAPSSNLASISHADGGTTSFAYNSRTAGDGTVYDLASITYPDGASESFDFDAAGHLVGHTDRNGNLSSFSYNAQAQPLVTTNALGGQTLHSYFADGTLESTTDDAGNLTTHTYDLHGRPMETTYPDLSTRSFVYDDGDNLTSTTDENGNTDSFVFDGNGRLVSTTDSLGNVSSFSWDLKDRLIGSTDPLGASDSRSYDGFDRVVSSTDANGNTTTFGRDTRGRVTSISDPFGNATLQAFDEEGVANSLTNRLGDTTSLISDEMGRTTQLTSPLGGVQSYGFDAMGRLSTHTNALGDVTTTSRDSRGWVSAVSLPGGITSAYVRDAVGNITGITDPNGRLWQRGYDARGFLTSMTDPLSRVETSSYNDRNGLTRVVFPGALGMVDLDYDPVGNPTSLVYSDGTALAFSYDANDHLVGGTGLALLRDANGLVSDSNGVMISRDPQGRISAIEYAMGKAVGYGYDANGNVTQVTDFAGGVVDLQYDAEDQLTSITRPNGVDTTQSWDRDQRLATITETGLSSIALTRDAEGQITSATRLLPVTASLAGTLGAPPAYDDASQIATDSYDELGRLTSDADRTLVWNGATRLTKLTDAAGDVAFAYDALGHRISRTDATATRNYILNYAIRPVAVAIEQESDSDLYYYVHLPTGELLYRINASTNARAFYHFDELGNTHAVTNDAGAVVAGYAYRAYGRVAAELGPFDNRFTWQGQLGVMSERADLYYMRARYYDARAARFVSKDPVQLARPKSINPYAYADANPLRYRDPLGTDPEPIEEFAKPHQTVEEILIGVFSPYDSGNALREIESIGPDLRNQDEAAELRASDDFDLCPNELQDRVLKFSYFAGIANIDIGDEKRLIEEWKQEIARTQEALPDADTDRRRLFAVLEEARQRVVELQTGLKGLMARAKRYQDESEAYATRARTARAEGRCGVTKSSREAQRMKGVPADPADSEPVPEDAVESVIPELANIVVL